MMNLFFYLKQKYGLGYRVLGEPADSLCEEYNKKRKRATAKMYSAAALFLFFLFLLWVVFSLHPYLNGFILPLIRFPIFR